MVREFKLPDVGEGVAEGEIVQWLVEEGDTVTEDQPVAEVETDKAVVEVPSPVDGTVKQLHYEAGDVVEVGAVIVTFDVAGEAPAEAAAESDIAAEADEGAEPDVEAVAAEEAEPEAEPAAEGGDVSTPEGRTFAPPSARRLARELGVDLSAVEGTGPSGRITEQDVRRAAESGGTETAEKTPPTTPETAEEPGTEPETGATARSEAEPVSAADRERTLATPKTRGVAEELEVDIDSVPAVEEREGEAFVTEQAVREFAEAQQAAQAADVRAEAKASTGAGAASGPPEAREEREERVPYRGVRRTIGERMEESKYTAPHVTHHDTVDVSTLVEARAALKERAEKRGVKLTYMPFVMKAVVAALQEFPFLNSSLDEDAEEIVKKHYYNIGVAVATDAGLMVPVVDDVDRKGLLELAAEVNDLATQARERTIDLEDLRGSTFSITNFGAIGGEYATPIINYPEVGILGLGAIEERPVVEDGEVVARPTLPLSLSIDHRVVDGAIAAEFTNTVMEYLKNPTLLLLE
ncbi:MAG: dihydrolipoamide acetyltransferase family protein [Halodesulfurarchaeum sp.]